MKTKKKTKNQPTSEPSEKDVAATTLLNLSSPQPGVKQKTMKKSSQKKKSELDTGSDDSSVKVNTKKTTSTKKSKAKTSISKKASPQPGVKKTTKKKKSESETSSDDSSVEVKAKKVKSKADSSKAKGLEKNPSSTQKSTSKQATAYAPRKNVVKKTQTIKHPRPDSKSSSTEKGITKKKLPLLKPKGKQSKNKKQSLSQSKELPKTDISEGNPIAAPEDNVIDIPRIAPPEEKIIFIDPGDEGNIVLDDTFEGYLNWNVLGMHQCLNPAYYHSARTVQTFIKAVKHKFKNSFLKTDNEEMATKIILESTMFDENNLEEGDELLKRRKEEFQNVDKVCRFMYTGAGGKVKTGTVDDKVYEEGHYVVLVIEREKKKITVIEWTMCDDLDKEQHETLILILKSMSWFNQKSKKLSKYTKKSSTYQKKIWRYKHIKYYREGTDDFGIPDCACFSCLAFLTCMSSQLPSDNEFDFEKIDTELRNNIPNLRWMFLKECRKLLPDFIKTAFLKTLKNYGNNTKLIRDDKRQIEYTQGLFALSDAQYEAAIKPRSDQFCICNNKNHRTRFCFVPSCCYRTYHSDCYVTDVFKKETKEDKYCLCKFCDETVEKVVGAIQVDIMSVEEIIVPGNNAEMAYNQIQSFVDNKKSTNTDAPSENDEVPKIVASVGDLETDLKNKLKVTGKITVAFHNQSNSTPDKIGKETSSKDRNNDDASVKLLRGESVLSAEGTREEINEKKKLRKSPKTNISSVTSSDLRDKVSSDNTIEDRKEEEEKIDKESSNESSKKPEKRAKDAETEKMDTETRKDKRNNESSRESTKSKQVEEEIGKKELISETKHSESINEITESSSKPLTTKASKKTEKQATVSETEKDGGKNDTQILKDNKTKENDSHDDHDGTIVLNKDKTFQSDSPATSNDNSNEEMILDSTNDEETNELSSVTNTTTQKGNVNTDETQKSSEGLGHVNSAKESMSINEEKVSENIKARKKQIKSGKTHDNSPASQSIETNVQEETPEKSLNNENRKAATKPTNVVYKPTFSSLMRSHFQKLATNHQKYKSNPEDEPVSLLIPLRSMLNKNHDRSELVLYGKLKYLHDKEEQKYHFSVYLKHIPSTKNSEDLQVIMNLIEMNFDKEEENEFYDKILNHEDTQAFNIVYHEPMEIGNGEVFEGLISTIIFRIVQDEEDPCVFVFYRCTHDAPLRKGKYINNKYKQFAIRNKGVGFGHFLLRITQQFSYEYHRDLKSYKMYLFANRKLVTTHYSKIGFCELGHVRNVDSDPLYKNSCPGLKSCFDIEGAYDSRLILLSRDTPFERDKICHKRILNWKPRPRIVQLKHSEMVEETGRMLQVIEKDLNVNVVINASKARKDISSDFKARGRPLINPISQKIAKIISSGAMLNLSHIIEIYENSDAVDLLTIVKNERKALCLRITSESDEDEDKEDDTDEEDESEDNTIANDEKIEDDTIRNEEKKDKNGVGELVLSMRAVDKFFLKFFAFAVEYTGKIINDSILNCEKGNIYCRECAQYIVTRSKPLHLLEQHGAAIMQYHLASEYKSIGFTSNSGVRDFRNCQNINTQEIKKCKMKRSSFPDLFWCINIDETADENQLKRYSENAIIFVKCALEAYYGKKHEKFKNYIPRSVYLLQEPLDEIRMTILKKKHWRIDKKQKDTIKDELHQMYKLYFNYGKTNKSFADRQKQLCTDILTNPKQKMMYLGEDLNQYKTQKEKQDMRNYLNEKETKFNWYAVELVNKETRDINKNPYPRCSVYYEKNLHWVGYTTFNGKPETFLVSHDMIPENYNDDAGELFTRDFFDTHTEHNTQFKIPQATKDVIRAIFKEHKEGAINAIRLKINDKGQQKWEGKTGVDGITYKELISEKWLKKNFEESYPIFFRSIMTETDVWHAVPAGGKSTEVHNENLKKIEDREMIPIFLGDEPKCAFANLANALYEIHDYDAASFFEDNINKNYKDLIPLVNTGRRSQVVMNEYMVALNLMQSKFGYQAKALKSDETLLEPLEFGHIKYVTLVASLHGGYKHVIAVVGDKILDSSNRKKLTLCKESVAWCSSKSAFELEVFEKTIEIGFLLIPPKRSMKAFHKRASEAKNVMNTKEKIQFRTLSKKKRKRDAEDKVAKKKK